MNIENHIRTDLPQVGTVPYHQIHAHSTGNANSTVQNEIDYFSRKDITEGFYTHIVGNGRVIQVGNVNRGAWDVGNNDNYETYAAVEFIESHATEAEFRRDYALYIQLLRDLANQAGLPVVVDSGDTGILTHNYSTARNNVYGGHTDPYHYFAKWGITQAQFKKDVENEATTNQPAVMPEMGKIGMFVYWNGSQAWGVWGNKRFYLDGPVKLDHFKNIVRHQTGKACIEYTAKDGWTVGSQQIKTVESFTEVNKTVA